MNSKPSSNPWKRRSVATRVALSLVLLSTLTLTLAQTTGLLPNLEEFRTREKTRLCEMLAISCSVLAQRNDEAGIAETLRATAERNPEIASICIRRADGKVIQQFGDHESLWHLKPKAHSTHDNIFVPISTGSGSDWGTVELSFAKGHPLFSLLQRRPMFWLLPFTLVINGLLFRWYLGRVLTYLDPAKSVPTHVRSTLDTFAEGVVVLDTDQRIVLANEAFTRQVEKDAADLQGLAIEKLAWNYSETDNVSPWKSTDEGPLQTGVKLILRTRDGLERTFLANLSAIAAEDGTRRGTIASFDDITMMEQKKQELSQMLTELKKSRDTLSQRNEELQYLATRDPLTGCVNRRTFFEQFETQWNSARRYKHPLGCIMVDVDHFKSVNDDHGHSVGDAVLRKVAQAMRDTARSADIVCRYGGEEFCILLPQTDIEQSCLAAERIRVAISELEFENLKITASLGVSSVALGAGDPQELIDQADKCLYIAKRSGRDQVARWDEVPADIETHPVTDREAPIEVQDTSLPYPAVASLLSALAYRDAATAAHSTRVAEMCVATAAGLLTVKQTYVLEVAALLHDIGKIGVPDAILLKPGPLTREEWVTMEMHDRIGVEIVEASFSSQQLVDVVRYHHATYLGSPSAPNFPTGVEIPIGARILTIADAYDAMVSDRVYRKGRSQEEAFQELRRCAGLQFDPELVERFIGIATGYKSVEVNVESKQTALQLGLQIERLAEAVDDQDMMGIRALASRLESTAASGGIPQIETVAGNIKNAADEEGNLIELLPMVDELLALCRSAQKTYANASVNSQPLGGTPEIAAAEK